MKTASVQTPCECQGSLEAIVDEAGIVLSGSACVGKGEREVAPATAIDAGKEQFQVGWLCPLCGRNTVRSFCVSALVYA